MPRKNKKLYELLYLVVPKIFLHERLVTLYFLTWSCRIVQFMYRTNWKYFSYVHHKIFH